MHQHLLSNNSTFLFTVEIIGDRVGFVDAEGNERVLASSHIPNNQRVKNRRESASKSTSYKEFISYINQMEDQAIKLINNEGSTIDRIFGVRTLIFAIQYWIKNNCNNGTGNKILEYIV